ncbi:MAG: hypothetical protein EU548_05455 [Promethearchaeota archaeon]|nr:MAG: hypothetical protein EU548_05455 [Candidatus Lokiarchaeota archaeon]
MTPTISLYIVDEFWIINFDGIPLFSYSPREELSSILISSFFSAIQKFALRTDDSNSKYINSLSLGESNFNFMVNNEYELYFISKSTKKIKEKLINKHLKEIEQMFLSKFEEDVKNFSGEITKFDKFEPTFEKYFKDKFTKLKSMW